MAAPAAATYVTEAEAIINVTIYTTSTTPGVQGSPVAWPSGIVWTTFEGGDPSAATTKLHPGNMIGAVEQPGPIERSGVTVTTPYTTALSALVKAGTYGNCINNGMQAGFKPCDAHGNPNGSSIGRSGLFKGLVFPKWDPTSGKTAMLGFVMGCDT